MTEVFGETKEEKEVKASEEQFEKLYAQIGHLKVETIFSKKVEVAYSLSQKRAMVKQHPVLSTNRQCELLSIHRSGLRIILPSCR
jgi:hypothetical protein